MAIMEPLWDSIQCHHLVPSSEAKLGVDNQMKSHNGLMAVIKKTYNRIQISSHLMCIFFCIIGHLKYLLIHQDNDSNQT